MYGIVGRAQRQQPAHTAFGEKPAHTVHVVNNFNFNFNKLYVRLKGPLPVESSMAKVFLADDEERVIHMPSSLWIRVGASFW
jgi:hypothetical protein